MGTHWRVKGIVTLALFLLATGPWAQAPAPGDLGQKPPAAAASALGRGQFEEALRLAESDLAKNSADLDASYVRVRALMGLGQYQEAARVALPISGQHPERPEFRHASGECAFAMGMIPQAIQTWSGLYGNPQWGSRAYVAAARALLAQGKEPEARKLLDEAAGRLKEPSPELLRCQLQVEQSVPAGLKTLDRLIQADPSNKGEYEGFKKLYAAAGSGELMEEGPAPAAPVTVPLKERSETRDISALYWGSMDSGTAELTTSSRVVIPAALNGDKTREMLLDSGADTVLVTDDTAKELGLEFVTAGAYQGMGDDGAMRSEWVLIRSIQVGALSIRNVPAQVIFQHNDFWKKTSGILPLSLFWRHGVLYDRRAGKLTVFPAGTKPETAMPGGSYSVRSLWFDGRPYVEVKVQEKPKLFFLLDTGAYTTFLAGEYAQEMGVRVNRAAETRQSSGLSGMSSAGIANDVTLWLGPARFKFANCNVLGLGFSLPVRCHGILGRNVLDVFRIYFDYSTNQIAFQAYDKG